jgi:hypothetical protein
MTAVSGKILREVERDLVRLRAFQPSAEPVAEPRSWTRWRRA